MSSLERHGHKPNLSEREQEAKNIRRLQIMISMVMSVIGQDPNLTVEEASELVAGAKRAALAMFPDKELRLRHSLQTPPPAFDERTLPPAIGRSFRLG